MFTPTTQHRVARQTAEDRQRLAAKGGREGVRILVDHRTGQHVATSASNPTGCYHVTADRCTCKGFGTWGRCKHHSLLLAELGRLEVTCEPVPDPLPPSSRGLSDAEVISLKADAMRRHVFHGEPLVHPLTGKLIADAA